MSDKPTTTPQWATAGVRTEPSAGQKAAAAIPGAKWAAQHANWLLGTISDWITWIADGYLTRASLADDTPVLATTDQDGRARHYLGAEGYWMGPAFQAQYVYRADTTYSNNEEVGLFDRLWATDVVLNNVAVQCIDPPVDFGAKMINFNFFASSGSGAAVFSADDGAGTSNNEVIGSLDDVVAVIEGTYLAGAVPNTGVRSHFGFAGNGCAVAFVIPDDGTQFRVAVNTSGSLDPTAGVATDVTATIVANTIHTLRVEYHGLATPLGVANAGAAIGRFFLDGVLVHERSTGAPSNSDWLGPHFGALWMDEAAAVPKNVYFGPVKMAWNTQLAQPVPA